MDYQHNAERNAENYLIEVFGEAFRIPKTSPRADSIKAAWMELGFAEQRLRKTLEQIKDTADSALRSLDRRGDVNVLGPIQLENKATSAAAQYDTTAKFLRMMLEQEGFTVPR